MATIKDLQDLKDQNSAKWHNAASQAEKDRLHQDNMKLQEQIDGMSGGSSSFDSSSGKWSSSAGTGSGGTAGGQRPPLQGTGDGGPVRAPGPTGTGDGGASGMPRPTGGGLMDDAGNLDLSKQWEYQMAHDPYNYDALYSIASGRENKTSGGGAYGQWSGDAKQQEMWDYLAGLKQQGRPGGPALPDSGVNDYSDYIEAMNKAQKEAALAALRAAFEKNVAGLDRTKQGIAPEYQSARNQAAGQSEQAKRQFAEYAAANGLNSGAGGQAQLAMGNALQNNLSGINTAEASTMADLELQRSQLESDYTSAIAQAEARGDYQKAQMLYEEKVRQDEAMRQMMMWKAQQELSEKQFQFQQDQAGISNGQWDQQFQAGQGQYDQSFRYKMAQELAQYGDFSGFEAMGIDTTQMKAAWEAQQQLAAMQAQGKGNGGGSGGGAGKPTLTYTNMMNAIENGQITPNVKEAYQYYMGAPWPEENTAQGGAGMSGPNFNGLKQTVHTYINMGQPEAALDAANRTWDTLTQAQRDELTAYFGNMGYTLGGG